MVAFRGRSLAAIRWVATLHTVVRLNVIRLLIDATRGVWRIRRTLLRSLPLPLAASMLIHLVNLNLRISHRTLSEVFNSSLAVVPIAFFALACHRAILSPHYPKLTGTVCRRASTRFVVFFVFVSLMSFAATQAFELLEVGPRGQSNDTLGFAVFLLAALYVAAGEGRMHARLDGRCASMSVSAVRRASPER